MSATASTAKELLARSGPDVDLRALVPGNHFLHKDAFQAQMVDARARNELVVVPLGLAGGGQLYWSFPGLVIIGAGIDGAEREGAIIVLYNQNNRIRMRINLPEARASELTISSKPLRPADVIGGEGG